MFRDCRGLKILYKFVNMTKLEILNMKMKLFSLYLFFNECLQNTLLIIESQIIKKTINELRKVE